MNRLKGYVEKGWGYEYIWASNDKYCGKILHFTKAGSKFSMHFHKEKDETWYVNAGKFKLKYIDTNTAQLHEEILEQGNIWRNPPLFPHQLESMEDHSIIVEVSTPDSVEDNYRIIPGDSQTKKEENETNI